MSSTIDYGFVQEKKPKGRPMLDKTEWIRINKVCHVLVDEDTRIIATVYTAYDEEDGDENLIWDVEIEDDSFGSFVSLYSAKLAVQRAIADWEEKQQKKAETKQSRRKKKTVKASEIKK